jgi:hypothetical protein
MEMGAILSQRDSTCGDTRFAYILQGGRGSQTKENSFGAFYSRIVAFHLTITVGCTRQYFSNAISGVERSQVDEIKDDETI